MTNRGSLTGHLSLIMLLAGPAAFLLILFAPGPEALTVEAQRVAALAVWMAIWWLSGVIPLGATALLPFVAFPFLDVMSSSVAIRHFAHWLNFLLLGGFLIAAALERWNLHKRIALGLIDAIGVTPRRIVLGFMVASAFISFWINNTATCLMMLPVAMAVLHKLREILAPDVFRRIAPALMLAIAYASSIGGTGSLIGTGPNGIFVAQMSGLYNYPFGFVDWLKIGIPFVVVIIPLAWLFLVRVQFPLPKSLGDECREVIRNERRALGPMSRAEKMLTCVAMLTALGWVTRKEIEIGEFVIPGLETLFPMLDNDAPIALAAAILLFALPVNFRKGEYLLDLKTALTIPWDILLIIGGGICLAAGFQDSGLSEWLAYQLEVFRGVDPIFLVLASATLITFLTEMTSNTATSTIFLPIMGALAIAIGESPLLLMIPACLACSMAFMLPVATPPNAVVYASGMVTSHEMARSGFWMNWIAITFITLIFYLVTRPLLGIDPGVVPDWAATALP